LVDSDEEAVLRDVLQIGARVEHGHFPVHEVQLENVRVFVD
jgi:hypothetical protein